MQLALFLAMMSSLPAAPGDAAILLAGGGQAHYVIATPPGPSQAESLAARELKSYLGRISGASFQITVTRSGDREILVGKSTRLTRPESFSIDTRDGRIVLAGADDRAVLYAAYAFLETLGCRWLAPSFDFYDGTGEVVPEVSDLRFTLPAPIRDEPALRFRKLYVEEGHTHRTDNLRQLIEWMPKRRFNTLVVPANYQGRDRVKWDNWRRALTPELQSRSIIIEVGGHGYQNFLSPRDDYGKMFDRHPDWFGMNEIGKRAREENRVFCTSNQAATAYLQRNVIEYLRDRPEIQIFDFWPPDGAVWCTCGACQKLGAPSQRHALLVAQTAQAVRKVLPKVRIECIAYATYLEPPAEISFDRSVLVDFCPIAQSFEYPIDDGRSSTNARYASALAEWTSRFQGDVSVYSYYRKYAWASLPVVLPHYMQQDLQYYSGAGVHGVSTYAEPGDWFTYELNHYVLGHLAWNPAAPVDAIIKEFCTARYKPAGPDIVKVFRQLEEITRKACSIPSTAMKSPAEYDAFASSIESSRRALKSIQENNARDRVLVSHVKRLDLMLEYALRDIELQRMTAARAPEPERREKIAALAQFLRAHANEGVFAMHGRLELAALLKNHGLAELRKPTASAPARPRVRRARATLPARVTTRPAKPTG